MLAHCVSGRRSWSLPPILGVNDKASSALPGPVAGFGRPIVAGKGGKRKGRKGHGGEGREGQGRE